jgi:hypothetical protein
LAYDILSQPSLRKAYDDNPYSADTFTSQRSAEDTFDGVLQLLFAEFMSGDFEIIRIVLRGWHSSSPLYLRILTDVLLGTIKEINPALNMEEETIDSVITGFRKLREIVLGLSLSCPPDPSLKQLLRNKNICTGYAPRASSVIRYPIFPPVSIETAFHHRLPIHSDNFHISQSALVSA